MDCAQRKRNAITIQQSASTSPTTTRHTLTAPNAGTSRLVVLQNGWVQRGFSLSITPTKDAQK
jgi:hypothetical protein